MELSYVFLMLYNARYVVIYNQIYKWISVSDTVLFWFPEYEITKNAPVIADEIVTLQFLQTNQAHAFWA